MPDRIKLPSDARWKLAGPLMALAAAAIASAMIAQAANSAGLSTTVVAGLRGAIEPLGLAGSTGPVATANLLAATPHPIPAHPLRSALVLFHVIGLTIGMGTALFLDFFLLARLYLRRIEASTADLLEFGSQIVSGGLILLWLSGLGLFTYYYFKAPFALENPKLIAKVTVVFVLTLNGFFLHSVVLPWVRARVGKPLLAGLPLRSALPMIVAGATSGVSWAFCCVLGMVKELNGVVPASMLVFSYAAALGVVIAGACIAHLIFGETRRSAAPSFNAR